jgi:hypothetical protein
MARARAYGSGIPGITFTFDATALGHLPTQVGIVWTDGAGTTLFEAFGPGGVPLGQIGPVAIADGSISGTTAEDRFFGVTNPGGFESIRISNTAGGIEVDHLQYGCSASSRRLRPPCRCRPWRKGRLPRWVLLLCALAWRALSRAPRKSR